MVVEVVVGRAQSPLAVVGNSHSQVAGEEGRENRHSTAWPGSLWPAVLPASGPG